MIQPSGYRAPTSADRDPDQVMADTVAQNLIAEIVQLHNALCAKLDCDVELAAQGPADPASGYVTGSGEHDQMLGRAATIRQAERERSRLLKNAQQRLRRDVQYYEDLLGVRCNDPGHFHTINAEVG